ncbi:mucin-2-like isoform X3 [Lytechinus pictus]
MAFLGQFYFQNREDNILNFTITYPADQCCYRLVVFDESYGQWGSIRPNEDRLTCRGKIDKVKDLEYKIKLTGLDPTCQLITDDNGFKWLVCQDTITFESRQRPQHYFVQLANCRSNRKGLRNVSYTLHMTNGKDGLWTEFAENQKFMMETDLAFFLGYVAMTIVATRFRYVLSLRKLLHLTYRLFYSSLFFKTVCLLLLNIDFSRFARTGLEMTKMQDAAEVFSWLSTVFFVCVLLLVSKGFSITRAQISLPGTVKTIVFGTIYLTFYTIVFFDQRVLLDPQDIITSMTSLSASGLTGLKFTGAIIFVYGCMVTIKNHPRKVPFYLPFAIFFSVWFVAEPTYRLLSLYVYPVLKSPNIWNGIDLALSFAGHAYFLYLTRPDRLNKRFPFHLRAGKVSFRDIDENVEDLYAPSKDFYSVFQTGKKSNTRTGPALTIPEEPQHFETPVVPFNALSEECLAVLPRPSLPDIPTVSATVDLSYRTPSPVIPTVSGTVQKQTPATSSVFVSMPSVMARQSFKITPAVPPTCKIRMEQIHEEDRTAVEISTASVPNGGFSVFCVQKQPDTGTSPVYDSITKEHKDTLQSDEKLVAPKGGYSIFSVNKRPDTPSSSKNTGMDVTDQTQTNSVNKKQSSGKNACNFLPRITPSIESTLSSSSYTIKGSDSDAKLANFPLENLPATCKPYQHQEPLKTKARCESVYDAGSDDKVNETLAGENPKQMAIRSVDDSVFQPKDTDETECYSQVNGGTKVRLISVRPAQHANSPLMNTGESDSDSEVPEIQSQNNSGTPNVRLIQVKPAKDPYVKIATTRQSRPADQALEKKSSTKECNNTVSSARFITVKSVHEPLPTLANRVSAALVQKALDATNETVPEIKSVSDDITISQPESSSLATNDVLQIKNLRPVVDSQTWQYPVPPPKIQNWTTEPLEQSKSQVTNIGQGKVSDENVLNLDNGHPTCPSETDIASTSGDHALVPVANGGDFSKPSKKTRKEPSQRRFPKSTNPGMTTDTSSHNQKMAMDSKTKKKKLKKFLKLARKHKNKPAKAD